MAFTENRDSLDRFEKLVEAALTLSLAGLANDPEGVAPLIAGQRFFFDVPYIGPRPAVRVIASSAIGALRLLLDEICERSGALAPLPPDAAVTAMVEYYARIAVDAPEEPSAHEVVAATTFLLESLVELGSDPAVLTRLMEPR